MIERLPQFVILLFSIVWHEVAHGRIALWRGDTTARDAGRLTLNPVPHIDPFGTVLFPLILFMTGSPVLFGWAKPVPVNPLRLRESLKDMAIISAAGPLSNFGLAVVFSIFLRLAVAYGGSGLMVQLFYYGMYINLILMIFNLVPIPPLDGSKILMAFLPEAWAYELARIERFGFIIIFLLLITGFFRFIIFPIATFLMSLLLM